ncbi:SWIM zinc finger family protein [Streptomyces yaizuensis]|uniref:SWIM zinc finger family protein n=1 Tax=Streptomyces yaizuensis TaxID=2989713 RepID=A0ABQ5P6H3_9ACTN|nr:SWIM zinc finger family protein [Streptomyces sp. YSPA8]GLF98179.1 SWIM zinc finger family protein [Streptomyces sp. YSPA8]
MTPAPTSGWHHRQRVFPPLPATRSRSFAETWWGNAWVQALEGPTRSATGRLARGRTYARAGNVGQITITPGHATAQVKGSQPTPYRTSMNIPPLTPQAWNTLLDTAAGQAGHLAALLNREMPTTLADTAAQAGIHLLPRPRELTPSCSCPDWGTPCKHAAALYYQMARILDEDPFVLLLLRGRGERELMDELHRRNATPPTTPAPTAPPGIPARGVFAAARAGLPPLPAPPPPVDHPGPVPELASTTAPAPGLDPAALHFLATDTAQRAAALLHQALQPHDAHAQHPAALSAEDDLVRLAAADPPHEIFTRLCWSGHHTPAALTRAARAWTYGGPDALKILDTPWEPGPTRLHAARQDVTRNWPGEKPPALRIGTTNWITVTGHDAQLRLSTGGHLWYPYRRRHGIWWPSGFPHHDVATVLNDLLETDNT